MKKLFVSIVVISIAVLALGIAGVAYAQTTTQNPNSGYGIGMMGGRGPRGGMGAGHMNGGEGYLHDYMIAAFAEKLNIPVDELESRIDNGETIAQIASSQGLTVEQFRSLMTEARAQAIDQALKDGKLTQEQSDWMTQRGFSQMGQGRGYRGNGQGQFANPNCPYYNQTTP
jgi:hypothetical protein